MRTALADMLLVGLIEWKTQEAMKAQLVYVVVINEETGLSPIRLAASNPATSRQEEKARKF